MGHWSNSQAAAPYEACPSSCSSSRAPAPAEPRSPQPFRLPSAPLLLEPLLSRLLCPPGGEEGERLPAGPQPRQEALDPPTGQLAGPSLSFQPQPNLVTPTFSPCHPLLGLWGRSRGLHPRLAKGAPGFHPSTRGQAGRWQEARELPAVSQRDTRPTC